MQSDLDLAFSEEQIAIGAAFDRFCTQHDVAQLARQSNTPFPRELWQRLAELGAFAPAAPGCEEGGGALALCAISETLGHHLFPGPIAATYLAIQILEADDASALIDGRALVSLSGVDSTLLPWGTEADIFLIADSSEIARAIAPEHIAPVSTLGGETWGRAMLKVAAPLPHTARGMTIGNISTAAYLASAAWRLIEDASSHATTRKQFGKSLGDFQAVSHPLADCATGVTAAQSLARAAACAFDSNTPQEAERLAAGAVISARRASLRTAFVCHQVFAGIGITLEGPVFHVSRRIRQLASTPPTGTREQDLLLATVGLGV